MPNTGGGARVLGGLALVNVALFAAYSGVASVLVPRQLEALDPAGKVGALALVLSISAAVTMFAQPIFGALSDGTSGRFGRRLPWMAGGAVVGGATLVLAGGAGSVAALVVIWSIGQFALNGTDVASTAYLVDRVPARRRGVAFAVVGIAAIAGGAGGAVLAGRFGASIQSAYWVLAAGVVVVVLLFALVVGDTPVTASSARPGIAAFFRGLWVDPRRHPDSAKLLGWRAASTIAYSCVNGYLFYLLTDYVGVGSAEAGETVGLVTIIAGAGVIVGLFVGGWLNDRVAHRKAILLGSGLLVAVGDIVAIVAPSRAGIVVVASVLGLALGFSLAYGLALGSELLPDGERGAGGGMGTLSLATNLGQAIAPLLAAAVIGLSGGYAALFGVSIAAVVAATGFLATIRDPRGRPPE